MRCLFRQYLNRWLSFMGALGILALFAFQGCSEPESSTPNIESPQASEAPSPCTGEEGALSSETCLNYADALLVGRDSKADLASALEIYSGSCAQGYAAGCWRLARSYLSGLPVASKSMAAPPLLAKACAGDVFEACESLAWLHLKGRYVPPDPSRSAALRRVACEGGHAPACWGLAQQHAQGLGCSRDMRRVASLTKQACAGGVSEACAARQERAGEP